MPGITRFPTFRDHVFRKSPPWLRRFYGERFMGAAIGLMADMTMEATAQALQVPWLRTPWQPPDALSFIGQERIMPRYPADTDATYRSRLVNAWTSWLQGGNEASIEDQLAAFGLDNVTILPAVNDERRVDRAAWSFEHPEDTANWSRFIVIINEVDDFVYGDPRFYGESIIYGGLLSAEDLTTIKSIIRKWKAGHTINPIIALQIGDDNYYGKPDLFYGGGSLTYGGSTDFRYIDHQV